MCIIINNKLVKPGVHDQDVPHHRIKLNSSAEVATTNTLLATTTRTTTARTLTMMMMSDEQFEHWMIPVCMLTVHTLLVQTSASIVTTETSGKLVI